MASSSKNDETFSCKYGKGKVTTLNGSGKTSCTMRDKKNVCTKGGHKCKRV